MAAPIVTIAVPSFNQGRFLEQALTSIFEQDLAVEVFVADGGSTDNSLDIICRQSDRLAGWRSDDCLANGGLQRLVNALELKPTAPAAYGKVWNYVEATNTRIPVWVERFSERRLALRCIVSQPGTLVRRSAWESVGGLDERLRMAIDYDLWWRLYKRFAPLEFVDEFVALNRDHIDTKTNTQRQLHYREAMQIVRRHHGRVPLKWWLAQPYAVWWKSAKNAFGKF
jgi:GT2 family glycosyltransferase